MTSVRRAARWIRRWRGRRVLVVGDLMLDRYLAGSVSRISPEAPVPVVRVTAERATPGGAANVALNVQSLGGRAVVAGVVGRDAEGRQLLQALRERGIGTEGVVEARGFQTIVKTRVVAERQQVVRVDREGAPEDVAPLERRLAGGIERAARRCDGIIVEDYGKGVVTQGTVDAALGAARRRDLPVGLDPKDNPALRFERLTLATPNYAEACAAAGLKPLPLEGDLRRHETLRRAGARLRETWRCAVVVITLGPHGMYLTTGRGEPRVIPARAREVFDVSGAGDTVIAAAMLGVLAGAPYEVAAELANYAAGVVVGKLGTATCSARELLSYMERG